MCFPQGNCPKVSSINDRSDWKVVRKALSVIGFSEDDVEVRTEFLQSVCFIREKWGRRMLTFLNAKIINVAV